MVSRYDPVSDRYRQDGHRGEIPAGSLIWQNHAGGLDPMEAYELRRLWRMDCKDGEPDNPPPAQVFTAPERH